MLIRVAVGLEHLEDIKADLATKEKMQEESGKNGKPGKRPKPLKHIFVRQRVFANCVSNEKRGRSGLFPILGY